MLTFLSRWAVTAVALALAAQFIDGIWFEGAVEGRAEIEDKIVPLLAVALISCAVTAFIKPVLKLFALPFILITLGLFLVVINALLLMLTEWLADLVDVGFHVTGFWPAVGGAIIISITTWLLDAFLDIGD